MKENKETPHMEMYISIINLSNEDKIFQIHTCTKENQVRLYIILIDQKLFYCLFGDL